MKLIQLTMNDLEEIACFFSDVFTREPWYDDWSDQEQLHSYIKDLIGNPNSLTLGLFDDMTLIGLSMGNIRHWYSGTEYCIDEFCIHPNMQGRGVGTQFLQQIETYLKQQGIYIIFLQTERTVPAYEFYKKNLFYELEDHVSFYKDFH